MPIRLDKEKRQALIASVERYFAEEMEEEIGDLKASLLLEFCLQEIGPCVYNQAILDAQAWMQERVTDLDGSCFEAEFTYWRR
jgi:uncharacterized protein (DUF2164 family)